MLSIAKHTLPTFSNGQYSFCSGNILRVELRQNLNYYLGKKMDLPTVGDLARVTSVMTES